MFEFVSAVSNATRQQNVFLLPTPPSHSPAVNVCSPSSQTPQDVLPLLLAQIIAIYTDTGNVASFGMLNETREKKNNNKEIM